MTLLVSRLWVTSHKVTMLSCKTPSEVLLLDTRCSLGNFLELFLSAILEMQLGLLAREDDLVAERTEFFPSIKKTSNVYFSFFFKSFDFYQKRSSFLVVLLFGIPRN